MEFEAIEQERRRIAKELHDEALPLLARLQRLTQQSTPQSAVHKSLSDELHTLTECLRTLLGELHPVDLQELGLVAALNGLCQRYSRMGRSHLIFNSNSEDCPLSQLQQLSIYRAIQLVLKAFSKSGSSKLQVAYAQRNDRICLGISSQSQNFSIAKFFLHELAEAAVDSIFAWCSLAGVAVQLSPANLPIEGNDEVIFSAQGLSKSETEAYLKFPCALVLSIEPPESIAPQLASPTLTRQNALTVGTLEQERIEELATIVSHVQQEWARLAGKDLSVITTMAVAAERQRLLNEIHSLVAPTLTWARQKMAALPVSASSEFQTKLDEIEVAINNSIAQIYPPELDKLNLHALIRLLALRFERATLTNIRVLAERQRECHLASEVKFAAYRIVQEILHNIEKHSEATQTVILVEHTKDRLLICIEDNGIGYIDGNLKQNQTLSRGIRTIRERAAEIGARVSWQESLSYENGTLVTISIPTVSMPALSISKTGASGGEP
jgi:signal transduction histidine kinase